MTTPLRITEAIARTWPPDRTETVGPFMLFASTGGGSRVTAARLDDLRGNGADVTVQQVDHAADAMRAMGKLPLFMVFDWQVPLDQLLASQDYDPKDKTRLLVIEAAALAAPPPPVTCFETWPPLAIQQEIWAEGGIGPDRLSIMDRVVRPKTSLFGRIDDRPAGTAFVAGDGDLAMLHALEITRHARRQGLAQHMMRAAGAWAVRQGCRGFATLVTAQNDPAQALYASLGFDPVGHYQYRTKLG